MQKNSSRYAFPTLFRVRQETIYYCGPAVVQMLLSIHNIEIQQSQVVEAAGVAYRVKEHGMSVPELGQAIRNLIPEVQFWHKSYSTITELSQIVNIYRHPVGVEWQGVFEDDEDEEEDEDIGHYSVVTHIDTVHNVVQLADPYKHYAGTDRVFSVLEFKRRWWDINEIVNPITRKKQEVDDYHTLFIITKKEETFPEKFLLQRS